MPRKMNAIKEMNLNHPHMQPYSGIRHRSPIKAPPSGMGQPRIYDPVRFPHMAETLCTQYGFVDKQLADIFGVTVKAIEMWKVKYPEFKIAVRKGKDAFDSCVVENSLLKIALGYEYQEKSVKTVMVPGVNADGKKIRVPAKEVTVTTKKLPPNAKAIAFWLTNRDKERWKNATTVSAEITSNTTHTEQTLNVTANLDNMNSDQLRALRELISTQKVETIEIEAQHEIVPLVELFDRADKIKNAEAAHII